MTCTAIELLFFNTLNRLCRDLNHDIYRYEFGNRIVKKKGQQVIKDTLQNSTTFALWWIVVTCNQMVVFIDEFKDCKKCVVAKSIT